MIELLAAAAVSAACSWDRPGHRPFTGDVPAAVLVYSDIPAPVRAKLQARMAARQYDDIAEIRRDSIAGKYIYAPDITGMHFGAGQVCGTVTRTKWPASAVERGLVYCEAGHCILVPTVCRNVSRITRLPPAVGVAEAAPVPEVAPVVPVPAEVAKAIEAPQLPAAPADSFASVASPEGPVYGLAGPVWFTPGPVVAIPGHTPAVPAPESWALLLAGLAFVAWKVRA